MIKCKSYLDYLDLQVEINDKAIQLALTTSYKDILNLAELLNTEVFSTQEAFKTYFLQLLSTNRSLSTNSEIIKDILKSEPSIVSYTDFTSFVKAYLEYINLWETSDEHSYSIFLDYYKANFSDDIPVYIPTSIYNQELNRKLCFFNRCSEELRVVYSHLKDLLGV